MRQVDALIDPQGEPSPIIGVGQELGELTEMVGFSSGLGESSRDVVLAAKVGLS